MFRVGGLGFDVNLENARLNVAVIGCGFMGTTHMESWRKIPGARIKGIVARSVAKAERYAEQHGARAYKDFEAILRDDSIDIVDVCTPTDLHSSQAVAALESGKHVVVEKPMALSLRDADSMIAAAKRSGKKLMVAHVLRFFPEYMKAKEVVDSGAVGELRSARAERAASLPAWSEWFLDRARSGGVPVDMAIHDVDFLRWCFRDEVERVYAKIGNLVHKHVSAYDHAFMLLRFRGGGIASIEVSWAVPSSFPFTMSLDLTGTDGMLNVDNNSTIPVKLFRKEGQSSYSPDTFPWRPSVHPFPIDPFYRELQHFADCVLHDKEPMTHGEESRRSLEVCLAAVKSGETGEPVRLPLGG